MTTMPEQNPSGAQNTPEDSDGFMSALEHESDDLWKFHRFSAMATLLLPFVAAVLAVAGALLWGGMSQAKKLVLATMASAAAGRFIIWTGDSVDQSGSLSPIQLAILVFCLDAIWAIVLTWHAGLLFRVPWLGLRLKAAVREGSVLLKNNRWMRRMTVAAVMAFVMLPVSSTGSIGGSLLGRLLGLSRTATLVSVLCGSMLGGLTMLAFAESLAPWFQEMSPAARYGGIAVLVLIGFVISRRYRRSLAD